MDYIMLQVADVRVFKLIPLQQWMQLAQVYKDLNRPAHLFQEGMEIGTFISEILYIGHHSKMIHKGKDKNISLQVPADFILISSVRLAGAHPVSSFPLSAPHRSLSLSRVSYSLPVQVSGSWSK